MASTWEDTGELHIWASLLWLARITYFTQLHYRADSMYNLHFMIHNLATTKIDITTY